MNKKICMVTTTSASISSFVLPTIKPLMNQGYEVSIVCSCENGFKEKLPEGCTVYDMPVGRGFDFKGTFKAALKFKKICKTQKFDIVMYTTPNGALYGSIGSFLAGVPARVLDQWGIRFLGFSGMKGKIICSIEKVSCRLATHIRSTSEKNRQIAISHKMYKPEKCVVLGKGGTVGVDLTLYDLSRKAEWKAETREKYNISDDSFVYGFSGRISLDKGCNELLTAFRKIHEENEDTVLLIVGQNEMDKSVDSELVEWASKNDSVVFTGRVDVNEMCKYYSAMDVLVHPTYREGFGMVIQEASAMQVAVITTDIPGASEVMENEISCLLAHVKDSSDLRQKMERLLNDKELLNLLSENARKRVETYFERSIMVRAICDSYNKIFEETRKEK